MAMSERYRGRWFMGMAGYRGPVRPVLRGGETRRTDMPEPIARLAYEEYANQGHGDQSFEHIHQRGGFSMGEYVALLADLVERERAKNKP